MCGLTIVTVVYNDKEGVGETLSNICYQKSNLDIEYIVVDGASNDGTIDVIKGYEDNIDVFISEPDSGLYYAMNKGIKSATKSHILFINAGDTIVQGQLDILMKELETDKFVFMRSMMHSDVGDSKWVFPNSSVNVNNVGSWLKTNGPNLQSCAFPRSFYKVNFYETKYRISSDMDYIGRCLNLCEFKFVDVVFGNFYMGGVSNTYDNFQSVVGHINESIEIRYNHFSVNKTKLSVSISVWFKYMVKFFISKKHLRVINKVRSKFF